MYTSTPTSDRVYTQHTTNRVYTQATTTDRVYTFSIPETAATPYDVIVIRGDDRVNMLVLLVEFGANGVGSVGRDKLRPPPHHHTGKLLSPGSGFDVS